MRKLMLLVLLGFVMPTNAQDLNYYLPDSVQYDPAIPKPKDIIYHEVGEYHVTHDRLVNYMKAIAAAAPARVKLETMGFTYERRPQVLLIITSPKNHQRLEEIRQQHLLLSDPARAGSVDIEKMPIVVYIGHSIHGNEPSGANAALVSAYYLAAAQGKQIDDLLENVVILFDPSFNPDGLQRFSTWANQHKGKNLVSDPASREFNEVWPGGRFNHYWFDLNRDWLPAVHVESQNRLVYFQRWKPNILTDHHEQGSNATFFFQPGVPSRVNPLTPLRNQELTAKLGKYHAQYLDRIGSLYFTKENYDDFYYRKGSTYPDINGGIGILFEQASSRGHLQQTVNGLLSFPFTIRNQFVTTLSTLEGARALRRDFLEWQREFYRTTYAESENGGAYVYGDAQDKNKTALFTQMLLRHQIEVFHLKNGVIRDGKNFTAEDGFIVPLHQAQSRIIRTIFEKSLVYRDSLFYDITSWTMPLAFGLSYAQLTNAGNLSGAPVSEVVMPAGKVIGDRSEYAYVFSWSDYNAPKLLYALQQKNILTKVATAPFTLSIGGNDVPFGYGSIEVPVRLQGMDADKLFALIKEQSELNGVTVFAVPSGTASAGSDLGSSKFSTVSKPAIAMLAGAGVNATAAGEVWYLLDQRMNIPATQLEQGMFNRVDLTKYNTIVLVDGGYGELNKEKLKSWVQSGGTLIVLEAAVAWAADAGLTALKFKTRKSGRDSLQPAIYATRDQVDGAQQMSGAIFGATVDVTNPLAYGYTDKTVSLFKSNTVFPEKVKNGYAMPFYYGDKPLQSGWVSKENLEAVKNSTAVVVSNLGGGRVISIADNPNFRAFWLGGSKLFLNAIFFGKNVDGR